MLKNDDLGIFGSVLKEVAEIADGFPIIPSVNCNDDIQTFNEIKRKDLESEPQINTDQVISQIFFNLRYLCDLCQSVVRTCFLTSLHK